MRNKNTLHVVYGSNPGEMVKKILDASKLADMIKPGSLIGLKPNLVVAKPASSGATTSPEVTGAVIEYLKDHGFDSLLILEGSWIGENTQKAFKVCGYEELSKKHDVPLYDTKKDGFTVCSSGGFDMEVCSKALEVDFLINLPVLKGHCQTLVTGALKNMKGCISDSEKRKFHTLGLHKPIAHLNKIRCADFVLVDGLCGDLDFEEGGNPVKMNRIICGTDSVLVDSYIASVMGYKSDEIEYIKIADSIGVGNSSLSSAEIIELNKDTTFAAPSPSGKVRQLSAYTDQRDACSACYANLIQALARLEERGVLRKLKGKIPIGQGFKNHDGEKAGTAAGTAAGDRSSAALPPGIGSCTAGFGCYLKGCPPETLDIITFLQNNI